MTGFNPFHHRRHHHRRHHRNPFGLRFGGIRWGHLVKLSLAGGAAVIVTRMVPSYLGLGVTSTWTRYGVMFGSGVLGYMILKRMARGYAETYAVVAGALVASELLQNYVVAPLLTPAATTTAAAAGIGYNPPPVTYSGSSGRYSLGAFPRLRGGQLPIPDPYRNIY